MAPPSTIKIGGYTCPRVDIREVDPRDEKTPDDWIPRHPDLVRLTGRHPFNCEPPVMDLMSHGFITPTSLHYVRNHGAAPNLDWDSHRVRISGLVDKPMELSMADFTDPTKFEQVSIPVTLVCAGNRRKEQNSVKQGIGFNWGPAAVSTSVWTGVRVRDVLEYCGLKSQDEGANHVCFVGADPLPGGYYGTSIIRHAAMDPASDVMLCWEQNGERLTPDHGYPIRLIIPGYIGGRMIKWLTDISVTEVESDNHYHYHDNRVLPPQIDADTAKADGWWYKPEYIINDLNINSAITSPAHDEVVTIIPGQKATYACKGYAYSGGGRKVTRVELSFDEGETWELTTLTHPERPTRAGKHWCWCFWEYEVPIMRMLRAKQMMVRAWDTGLNTQPMNFTWNVMGMMNNCTFKVRIHDASEGNGLSLKFEHPTQPGVLPGGWMVPKVEVQAAVQVEKKVEAKAGVKYFTEEEVAKHTERDDAWFIYDGKVYDATPFMDDHPSGADSILLTAGEDATEEFDSLHSEKAKKMLDDYYIGELGVSAADIDTVVSKVAPLKDDVVGTSALNRPKALNKKKKMAFALVEREEITHNVRRLRFALQSPEHVLGLPVGQHMFVSAKIDGALCMRAYTPLTGDEVQGYFDLLIKVYYANEHPKFPEGGKMSQHLNSLTIGQTIDVRGPLGHIDYKGKGLFDIDGKEIQCRDILMMAGGTGITPMWQVMSAVLRDEADSTKLNLIFANNTEDDILLQEELNDMDSENEQCQVYHTIATPKNPETWSQGVGFITQEMVEQQFGPARDDAIVFLCGPPPMINFACLPALEALGYKKEQIFQF
uniref:Nitrate reductase n=1 Tax=Heterosigma akashiwo TaxID=2829 RepID=C6K2H5_HETAK|nr:nitrate reductase [Heterosigma akashiwo]